MKILVVEDEKELADVIVQSLEKEQFVLETAHNFNDALDKIIDYEYELYSPRYHASRWKWHRSTQRIEKPK